MLHHKKSYTQYNTGRMELKTKQESKRNRIYKTTCAEKKQKMSLNSGSTRGIRVNGTVL